MMSISYQFDESVQGSHSTEENVITVKDLQHLFDDEAKSWKKNHEDSEFFNLNFAFLSICLRTVLKITCGFIGGYFSHHISQNSI